MKVLFTTVFLFICIMSNLYSDNNYNFTSDNFDTDLNGIIQNDNIVLAYGTRGIIYKTIDFGYTWKKVTPLKKYNDFLRILEYNKEFLALCRDSIGKILLKSKDGEIWTKVNANFKSQCSDMLIENGEIYFINFWSNQGETYSTIEKMSSDMQIHEILNTKGICDGTSYFAINNDKIFLFYSGKFIRIGMNDGSMDTIYVEQAIPGKSVRKVPKQYLKKDGIIYLIMDSALVKSADNGTTWEIMLDDSIMSYTEKDNKFYTLKTRNSKTDCYKTDFVINKIIDGKVEKISDIEWERYLINIQLSDMSFIDENTLLAVGDKGFISISYDDGKTWLLINNLDVYGNAKTIWTSDEIGFITGKSGAVYKTTDGGEFWKPQFYTDTMKSVVIYTYYEPRKAVMCGFSQVDLFDINENNEMFLYNATEFVEVSNSMISKDFGETYIPYCQDPLKNNGQMINFKSGKNNSFIINSNHSVGNGKSLYNVFLFRLDQQNNYKEEYYILNYFFLGIKDAGNIMYAYGSDCIDSLIKAPPERTVLAKSIDSGRTWTNVRNYSALSKKVIFGDNYFDTYDFDLQQGKPLLHRYDLETGDLLDSTYIDLLGRIPDIYFKYGKRAFIFGDNAVFINENIDTDLKNWDKYAIDNSPKFQVKFAKGNTLYGSFESTGSGKMTITGMSDVKETEISDYLYAVPPYPVPAKDYVKGKFYYYYAGGLASTEINIYNSMGVKVATNKDLEIEPQNGYTAELKWNCSAVPAGTYLIVISTPNGKSQTLPVMVAR